MPIRLKSFYFKVSNLFSLNQLSKNQFIYPLQIIYEKSNSEVIRTSCLKIISSLDENTKNLFKFFELAAVSDPIKKLRFLALKIILQNYLKDGIKLVRFLVETCDNSYILSDIYKIIVNNIRFIQNDLISKYKELLDDIDVKYYRLTEKHIILH